jgi:hypothetical protein
MLEFDGPLEPVIVQINSFDREGCIDELRQLPYLHLDFSDDFLEEQSLDGLRHILMAAYQQAKRHRRSA